MLVSIIAAVAENRVIGKDNDLVWSLPEDMQFFKETTVGHPVIMGRKNYESIPLRFRPLPNRTNIILTRQEGFHAPECIVVSGLEEALEEAGKREEKECFIIGGAEIFQLALDKALCNRMYITWVHDSFDGDVFFPEIDFSNWESKLLKIKEKDARHPSSFSIRQYDILTKHTQ